MTDSSSSASTSTSSSITSSSAATASPSKAPLWIMLAMIFSGFLAALLLHPGNQEQSILDFVSNVGTKNKGTLLKPLVDLNQPEIQDFESTTWQWHGVKKNNTLWTLLVPVYGDCAETCQQRLFGVNQVHTRLDKYARRAQKIVLLDGLPSAELATLLKEQYPTIKWLKMPKALFDRTFSGTNVKDGADQQVYIVDPRGIAMMFYSQDNHPVDMLDDMKFLLSNSL